MIRSPRVVTLLAMTTVIALAALANTRGAAAPRETDGAALGRAYAPALVFTYADAWLAAADALDEGGSVTAAQKTLQEHWAAARLREFRARVEPGLSRVLPEGTEPTTKEQRAKISAFWRSFASGLKSKAAQ
jgi:hypothetical protein